jgi:hypothetical protein
MAFDENNYKRIFESRYGAGSYDSGLSQARQIGTLKAQAAYAKKSYSDYQEKQQKKTYDDALSYWNDPTNKEELRKKGVYRTEQEIRNDPRKKEEIQSQGYSIDEFIDGLYSAGTEGDSRSKREYNQKAKNNKQTASENPRPIIPLPKKAKSTTEKRTTEKQKNLLPQVKKKENKKTLWDDVKDIGKLASNTLNPFDDVSVKDAYNNYLHSDTSKAFKEVQRGSNRAVDSASFGAMSNFDKRVNHNNPDYLNEREWGKGKGTDMITTGLGYLVPGSAAYKGLNASKLGKAITEVGNEGLLKRLAAETAKGGLIGGGMAGAEVATREVFNPADYNALENTKHIAFGTALGGISDPLLYGAGKGFAKGMESAANRTMRNLLPNSQQVESTLLNSAKSLKGTQALPKTGGIQNPGIMNDLIPRGNDITNPNFLPSLNPKTSVNPLVPKIGKSINELPSLKETSLLDRSLLLDGGERTLPDYSASRTLAEKNPTLANMLPPSARTLPDYSYGKPTSEPIQPVNQYGVEVPFDKVEHAPADYWRGRYEEFAQYVNKNYDSNNLSKEALDDLWTQFARNDEPVNLEQVVDLAYPTTKESPVLDARNIDLKRQPATQKAKDILGINDSAFKLPEPSKPINTADVWNKMGNRPPVSNNAKKILLGQKKQPQQDLIPKLNTIQEPLSPVETPKIRTTQAPVEVPKISTAPVVEAPAQLRSAPKANERSFYNTVQNPEKLSPEMEQRLNDFDKTYKPMSNEETVKFANEFVAQDMEKAFQFVKNARKFDPRHITVGHRLIDELQKAGQYDRALDVVERLAEQGTKAGQSIQSYSIYNRLSAEGQLLRAQRRVNKINESIVDPNKQVKLTEQNVQDITHTADSIKRFTGQSEQANNVIKIMDSIKKGNLATDAELDVVRSFVSDAKKFVSDLDPGSKPKPPKPIKDVRTRDKVVDFMTKREEVARQRLRQKMNRANSLPVDMFYDLSIIGASKIAKGTVKVADFTEEMVKEFGEMVRPYANQIYNKAVDTFNLQSESMTRQRLSEVEKITNKALKDKSLSTDEAETIKEFARRVGAMSGDAKLEASMELQTTLQLLERPTFAQKLSTSQTIAQLLNPKTIVRNAIGNEMFYRVEQMNKLVATPVDILRSKITGGERLITFRANNQGEYWRNWLTGAKAGWKGVNPMGLQTQFDLGPQAFRSKWNPLTYLEKSLGATLRSFDHAGYMRAYNKSLGELATLRATNEGLKGTAKKEAIARYIREADENMLQMADQYGKYATFQDSTVLSTALTKVKKGMNKVSTLGATEEFGLGDLVLKYPKTPGNLVMRALEYSPAGVVRSAHLLKGMAKTKDPVATRDFWLSFTRAITGTGGFSLLGYALANKGILTSSGNSDYEVASLEKNAGKQPNSVNTTALMRFIQSGFNLDEATAKKGDTFVSYDWAQPISIAIALGTGVNQAKKENGKLDAAGAAKGALDSGANTVINQSVLKGLNDFLANYPGRTMSDRVGDAAKGAVGSFVPTLSNQFRQIGDNTARTTYSPNLLPEIKNRAINRIPGVQSTLPPAYDTLGNRRQTYQNDGNSLLNVFLNPSFVSKYNPSPEAEKVLNLINETGDKTLAPRMAQKKIDGQPLTTEQYSEYQRIMGEQVQNGLSHLRSSSNNEALAKAIDKILRDAGKTAREQIRQEMGD